MGDNVDLVFTKLTGTKHDQRETQFFNDAVDINGFPANLKGIEWIKVYANGDKPESHINGLKVKYKGINDPINHGVVDNEIRNTEETETIDDNHLLVGAYGRLKRGFANFDHLNTITFVLFNKTDGTTKNLGPFRATTERDGDPWGTFGQILAFHGTVLGRAGLTSLGFVKASFGPFQGVQLVQNPPSGSNVAELL